MKINEITDEMFIAFLWTKQNFRYEIAKAKDGNFLAWDHITPEVSDKGVIESKLKYAQQYLYGSEYLQKLYRFEYREDMINWIKTGKLP